VKGGESHGERRRRSSSSSSSSRGCRLDARDTGGSRDLGRLAQKGSRAGSEGEEVRGRRWIGTCWTPRPGTTRAPHTSANGPPPTVPYAGTGRPWTTDDTLSVVVVVVAVVELVPNSPIRPRPSSSPHQRESAPDSASPRGAQSNSKSHGAADVPVWLVSRRPRILQSCGDKHWPG